MSQSENKVHIFTFVEIGGFLEREDIDMNEKEGEVRGGSSNRPIGPVFSIFTLRKALKTTRQNNSR